MKNKRTIYVVGFLIFAIVVYILFFRKKKPQDLKVGDTSIVTGPKNIPTVFKCKRTINPGMDETYKMTYKSSDFPLMYGDCGMAVESLQNHLIKQGKNVKADGMFGRQTEKALNEIYKSKDQAETGKFTYNQFIVL